MTEKLVTIATFQFLAEAEASKLRLEAEGLTVFLANAEIVKKLHSLERRAESLVPELPARAASAARHDNPMQHGQATAHGMCPPDYRHRLSSANGC